MKIGAEVKVTGRFAATIGDVCVTFETGHKGIIIGTYDGPNGHGHSAKLFIVNMNPDGAASIVVFLLPFRIEAA